MVASTVPYGPDDDTNGPLRCGIAPAITGHLRNLLLTLRLPLKVTEMAF